METLKAMTPKEWVKFLQHIEQRRSHTTVLLQSTIRRLRGELGKLDPSDGLYNQIELVIRGETSHLRLLEKCKGRISRSLAVWKQRQDEVVGEQKKTSV